MPERGLPLFVDEVPRYEARGEFMFVRWRGLEIAMPISVCREAVAGGAAALAEWRIAQSGKIERIGHWRDHAASS